ncbi:NYN domain-containing protein [Thiospirochaeta perfilievii]|uniref:NYN domain-containing protein n=1 Tax=Thiospirochaeta perfilievii TaxID=252967 RepID=A0A5C1QBE5_9SPIO|nr:NYN domain-containing protein [Thiospirochaeta perfilievii]QEN03492.1 NYN domain-containing protein [Thiospirochaeta perfilievii]
MENVAIFWDIENVTPKSNNTLFIEGMWEYSESIGRVVSSHAYADWSKPQFRKIGPVLSSLHFHMVHIPREKTRKNSADMQLVTDCLELLRYYHHIDTYVLITGDSDFRPLLHTLRKTGKKIHIICDITTASQDLLYLADFFVDYRDIIHYSENEHEDLGSMFTVDEFDEDVDSKIYTGTDSREFWYPAIGEAAALLEHEGKKCNMSTLKIKLKMLNPDFDEKKLGFKRWSLCVHLAAKAGYVILLEKDNQTIIKAIKDEYKKGELQTSFSLLVNILNEVDPDEFKTYAIINSKMENQGVVFEDLGYKKFKKYVLAAEVRGLVETKNINNAQYLRAIRR